MKSVALYEAKNRLSELCKRVTETGEPCVISRRGRPIVKLVPYDDAEQGGSVWDTVEEARAKYGPLPDDFEIPERSREVRPSPFGES